MPIPRSIARANRYLLNPVIRQLATRLPLFGVVVHTGRKSGRQYRTPVNIFPHENGYVIALTYGRDSEWVHNVLANGGCTLETRGRSVRLGQPRLFHDERRLAVPKPVGVVLGLIRVDDFLELDLACDDSA